MEPREDDRKEIERLRQLLNGQLDVVDTMQKRATPDFFAPDNNMPDENPAAFDDLDASQSREQPIENPNIPMTRARMATAAAGEDSGVVTPERRMLSIPSTWQSSHNPYRLVELDLRTKQAAKTLQALRDTIADKSFQYSHVIRVAPRKGVRTRAHGIIANLNYLIEYYCRVYGRCHQAMVRLDATPATLSRYRILLKEDVRSSTALLNPNEPGSTRMKLSWVWQTGPDDSESSPAALYECRANITPPVLVTYHQFS